MKKLIIAIAFAALSLAAYAQGKPEGPALSFTEATDLTIVGKVFPDTPNPYQRMDFTKYGGWDKKDINLLEMSSGIIVSFKTNSSAIYVNADFSYISGGAAAGWASRGFDLYIKKDGKWLWAGVAAAGLSIKTEKDAKRLLVENMDDSMKDCILYLPTYSKLNSVRIGVVEGSKIKKGDVPFRHRICLHGSSFMHGASTTRAGLTVPGYLTRMTGLQFCSLGVSGDCRMQPQFANALKDAPVEAFVFDAFSNGSAGTVEKSLFKFIETIQSGKPGVPLIFMKTIWRERRNFNQKVDEAERLKAEMADKLMKEAVQKYKDVYYIECTNATSEMHDTTADGTHPGDYGYYLWAASVKDAILEILAKYGIR